MVMVVVLLAVLYMSMRLPDTGQIVDQQLNRMWNDVFDGLKTLRDRLNAARKVYDQRLIARPTNSSVWRRFSSNPVIN